MSRPVIGVTAYDETVHWEGWVERSILVPATYTDRVAEAGGIPVVLPPDGIPAVERIGLLDGVVLTGGPDIDPAHYGQEPHPRTGPPRAGRDAAEMAIAAAAMAAGVPVLAICRGLQLLNASVGGTLHQHLPDVVGHERHGPDPGSYGQIKVDIAPASRLAGVLGATTTVACHHHQCIDAVAPELTAAAWADDGTVEAVEHTDGSWVVGVQWHPEEEPGSVLIAAFMAAARERADRRDR